MTSEPKDRIVAAFDREVARWPMPLEFPTQAVERGLHGRGDRDSNRQPWALALVAAMLAVAIVATLVFGSRALHPRVSVPATTPGASPSAQSTAMPSPSSPLALSTPAFNRGEVGVPYGPLTIGASGGIPPYQWSISAGALPSGLAIDSNGVVSGTPAAAGTSSFTVQVTDATNTNFGSQASLTIAPALTAGYLSSCPGGKCYVEANCSCGQFGYVNGGAPPYSYSITGGQLPPTATLNGLALEGRFDLKGTSSFEVTITDGLGAKAILAPTFTVGGVWLFGATCTGDYNTGCSARLPISGGIGPVTISAVMLQSTTGGIAPPLPPGFSAVVSGGAVVVTFPKGIVGGYKGRIWVQIADQYTTNAMSPGWVDVNVAP